MKHNLLLDHGQDILKGAILAGLINGIINGTIQLFLMRQHAPLPMSVDAITNDAHTVFGTAVPLTVVLAMILTVVGHVTLNSPKKKFWPHGIWLTLWHGMMSFTVVGSFAVLWQRVIGEIEVSLLTASMLVGLIAALVAGVVNYRTNVASRLRPIHTN